MDSTDFLNDQPFNLNVSKTRLANTERILTGGIFISHSGLDMGRITDEIVYPIIYDRFADGYFLKNQKSGGSESYKAIVNIALQYCDKFIVVVSRSSVESKWVQAEVAWALANQRTIIVCLFDEADPSKIHPALTQKENDNQRYVHQFTVDFQLNQDEARKELAAIIDSQLSQTPYERFPNG